MNRRSVLKLLGVGGIAGIGGCLGQSGEPDGTKPLTDSFSADSEPQYWHHSLTETVSLATANGLFVLSERTLEEEILTRYRSTISRFSRNGSELWSRTIDAQTRDLQVMDGTVYLFRGEDAITSFRRSVPRLQARETTTGDHRWDQPVGHHPNFVGANTDAVFVGATSDDPGRLPVRAFGAASGQSQWQTETAMPRGGTVTHGLCLVHGHPDEAIALDVETGAKRWKKTLADIERMRVFGDTLVILTDAGATAFSLPGGNRRWHRSGKIQTASIADAGSGHETTLFLGETNGTVTALGLESGDVRWSITPSVTGESEWVRGIAPAGDTVVVRKWGTLYGLDAADGQEQWRQVLTPYGAMGGPVAIDRTAFVVHSPTRDGFTVKTFDIDSGRKQWKFQSNAPMPTSTVFADQFVVASGGIYGFSP